MQKIIETQNEPESMFPYNALSFILLIGISENKETVFQSLQDVVNFEVKLYFIG